MGYNLQHEICLANLAVLAVGLLLAWGRGLYFGWYVWPTEFNDASLRLLDETHQYDYVLMIAESYALDGDVTAARTQLLNFDRNDPVGWYQTFVIDAILAGRNPNEIQLWRDSPLRWGSTLLFCNRICRKE